MFEKEELKPIDTSKYKITETGQVLKMTKEELEREYYGRRPTGSYSEDDSPNDWANIVQYAEENLDKAFKAIAELEKEKCELLGLIQGKDKVIQELEKENAELKSKNCWKTCEYAEPKSQWISQHIQDAVQLIKAKEIIKDYMTIVKGAHTAVCGVPEENRTIHVLKLNEKADQFLNSEVEE